MEKWRCTGTANTFQLRLKVKVGFYPSAHVTLRRFSGIGTIIALKFWTAVGGTAAALGDPATATGLGDLGSGGKQIMGMSIPMILSILLFPTQFLLKVREQAQQEYLKILLFNITGSESSCKIKTDSVSIKKKFKK